MSKCKQGYNAGEALKCLSSAELEALAGFEDGEEFRAAEVEAFDHGTLQRLRNSGVLKHSRPVSYKPLVWWLAEDMAERVDEVVEARDESDRVLPCGCSFNVDHAPDGSLRCGRCGATHPRSDFERVSAGRSA